MTDDLSALLQRYLDDRDSLTEDEFGVIVEKLRKDPQQLVRLQEQLIVDELLAQWMTVDRRNFVAQIEQRIRDESSEARLEQQVEEMQELAASEWDRWRGEIDRGRMRRRWWLALAGSLLAGGAVGGWLSFRHWGPIAEVVSVDGEAVIRRHGQELRLTAPAALYSGDTLITKQGAGARLVYVDRTTVEVRSQSELQFQGRRTARKVVQVKQGDLSAEVQPQPAAAPMLLQSPSAEATVLGTELFLRVTPQSTRLDVTKGRVRFTHRGASADVGDRQYAYAMEGVAGVQVERLQWPTRRAGLVLQSDFGDRSAPSLVDERGKRYPLQRRGEARAHNGELALRQGAFLAEGTPATLLAERCSASNEWTMEAVVQTHPEDARRARGSTLVSFSREDELRNFAITQKEAVLLLHLDTVDSRGRQNAATPIRLCSLGDAEPHHMVVTYRSGRLTCYLDGKVSKTEDRLTGGLDWQTEYLVLGDHWSSGDRRTRWAGRLFGLAFYARYMEEDEAYRNARVFALTR